MSETFKARISERGFKSLEGIGSDDYGNSATIYESSLATKTALWFGMRATNVVYGRKDNGPIELQSLETDDHMKRHYVLENSIHVDRQMVGFLMLMMSYPTFAKSTDMVDLYGHKFTAKWHNQRFVIDMDCKEPLKYFDGDNGGWQHELPFELVSANMRWSYSQTEVDSMLTFLPHWVNNCTLPTPVMTEEIDERKQIT